MYADTYTDKVEQELINRISREYSKASKEMEQTWLDYISGYNETKDGKLIHHKGLQERYEEQYEAYIAGKYTKDEFDAWYKAQVIRGERYKKVSDELAWRAVHCNEVAAAYINDKTPGIWALNANYTSYEIAMAVENANIDFTIHNEQAIKRLIGGKNFTEFRTVSINPKRDYAWNKKLIDSALTSGILQGQSIDKLSNAFLTVMGRNKAAAVRNARTAVTAACNGGRLDSAVRATQMGIDVMKQWHTMEDGSVRLSHQKLDGEIQELDEPFSNGLMYPGDPAGAPKEVYNCRCRMEKILPKYSENANKQSFNNWLESRQ